MRSLAAGRQAATQPVTPNERIFEAVWRPVCRRPQFFSLHFRLFPAATSLLAVCCASGISYLRGCLIEFLAFAEIQAACVQLKCCLHAVTLPACRDILEAGAEQGVAFLLAWCHGRGSAPAPAADESPGTGCRKLLPADHRSSRAHRPCCLAYEPVSQVDAMLLQLGRQRQRAHANQRVDGGDLRPTARVAAGIALLEASCRSNAEAASCRLPVLSSILARAPAVGRRERALHGRGPPSRALPAQHLCF